MTKLRHSQVRNRVWLPALALTGLKGAQFHDLRHAGNGLAVATGPTLRELVARMGHSSSRAALIYLDNSDERRRRIPEGSTHSFVAIWASERRPPETGGHGPDNLVPIWHKVA